jgi:hypothetical protein
LETRHNSVPFFHDVSILRRMFGDAAKTGDFVGQLLSSTLQLTSLPLVSETRSLHLALTVSEELEHQFIWQVIGAEL